ncbi:MAG: hypothetical protein Q9174_006902, partial [Haloplaca sp. 1 TL-2023]
METSPLTQQNRPGSFQPKIDNLYEQILTLYENEGPEFSDRFWTEFFLLKPDKASLRRRLENIDPDDLLRIQNDILIQRCQEQTQQFFRQGVAQISSKHETSVEFALDTLTVFLGGVLSKRYTNPSAEIITILAGLDEVDDVFLEFAGAIENAIRLGGAGASSHVLVDRHSTDCVLPEIRRKAVNVAIALTAGAYQTSLVSYFTHRDLFPALIKCMQDVESLHDVFEPFLLLGLLANYNKFEFRNPYRVRLEDLVNEPAIHKIIRGLGAVCARSRDQYVVIQEDIGEGWTWSSTLKYIGLGVLAPNRSATPTRTPEEAKDLFADLPGSNAAIILPIYDLTNANRLFRHTLASLPDSEPKSETPFSAFLSQTSYILNHAYRSHRATLYGLLNLTTLRILIEDPPTCVKLFDPALAIT